MSALSDKGITLEGLAAAVDSLRQELATWKALAHKQDQLSADQITATQSGATAAKISQIAVNTAAIQSLAAQVAGQISLEYVTTLPATGEPLTLYLVPQGDGTAPNFCNEYLWVNNDWELIGTTGAMANNGELTIQVNGVTVGTFTANQAANAAVNITVPTNTNQLVNGAQFVDAAALQAALALKQNSLNTAQLEAVNSGITAAAVQQIADNATAIAGKQDKLSTAQQAAVDSGATVAKIDQIAANAAAIVALTSGKQDSLTTTQLAAVNSGVTAAAVQQISTNASNISGLQTAVASKAADNSVVHLAGAETISGDKTFTGATATHNITPETDGTYQLGSSSLKWGSVYANSYYYGSTQWGLDQNNTWTGVNTFSEGVFATGSKWPANTNTTGDITSLGQAFYCQQRASGTLTDLSNGAWNVIQLGGLGLFVRNNNYGDIRYKHFMSGTLGRIHTLDANGYEIINLVPADTNTYDLGTSSNKWRTLNGINPGALSLPDANKSVTVDTTNYTWTGSDNTYVAPADGWLSLKTTTGLVGRLEGATTGIGSISERSASNRLVLLHIPVLKNESVTVSGVGSNFILKFYPCLGNV